MSAEGIDFAQAELVIERLAEIAEAMAWQAGVGATETAGHFISYLCDHPRDIEPFLRFGVFELPHDWHVQGRLSYHAGTGKVIRPVEVRRAATVRRLLKVANAPVADAGRGGA